MRCNPGSDASDGDSDQLAKLGRQLHDDAQSLASRYPPKSFIGPVVITQSTSMHGVDDHSVKVYRPSSSDHRSVKDALIQNSWRFGALIAGVTTMVVVGMFVLWGRQPWRGASDIMAEGGDTVVVASAAPHRDIDTDPPDDLQGKVVSHKTPARNSDRATGPTLGARNRFAMRELSATGEARIMLENDDAPSLAAPTQEEKFKLLEKALRRYHSIIEHQQKLLRQQEIEQQKTLRQLQELREEVESLKRKLGKPQKNQ